MSSKPVTVTVGNQGAIYFSCATANHVGIRIQSIRDVGLRLNGFLLGASLRFPLHILMAFVRLVDCVISANVGETLS